jgi:hypothetical protein
VKEERLLISYQEVVELEVERGGVDRDPKQVWSNFINASHTHPPLL